MPEKGLLQKYNTMKLCLSNYTFSQASKQAEYMYHTLLQSVRAWV